MSVKNSSRVRSNKMQLKILVDYMCTHDMLAMGEFPRHLGPQYIVVEWNKLKNILKQHGPDKTVEQWKQSWKDLKKTARAELAKARSLTGNSTDEPIISELSRKILDTIGYSPPSELGLGESQIEQPNESELHPSESVQVVTDTKINRKRTRSDPLEFELQKPKLIEICQEPLETVEYEKKANAFTVYVGEQLEQLDKFQCQVAEKLISDVLFLAKTGNLNYDSRVVTRTGSQTMLSASSSFTDPPSPQYIVASSSSKSSQRLPRSLHVKIPSQSECNSSSSSPVMS